MTTIAKGEGVARTHDLSHNGFLGIGKTVRSVTITDKKIIFLSKKGRSSDTTDVPLSIIRSVRGEYKTHLMWPSLVGIVLAVPMVIFGILSAASPVWFTVGVVGGLLLYFLSLSHLERGGYELEFEFHPAKYSAAEEKVYEDLLRNAFGRKNKFHADDRTKGAIAEDINEML